MQRGTAGVAEENLLLCQEFLATTRALERARGDLAILNSKWNITLVGPLTPGADISFLETVEPALFDKGACCD